MTSSARKLIKDGGWVGSHCRNTDVIDSVFWFLSDVILWTYLTLLWTKASRWKAWNSEILSRPIMRNFSRHVMLKGLVKSLVWKRPNCFLRPISTKMLWNRSVTVFSLIAEFWCYWWLTVCLPLMQMHCINWNLCFGPTVVSGLSNRWSHAPFFPCFIFTRVFNIACAISVHLIG